MAGGNEHTVTINGYDYQINGKVGFQSVDPFPDPVRFGDASFDYKRNLSPWKIECTGGIGNENYRKDEPTKTWFTNCITEYPGHILPPRLTTKTTTPTTPSAPTITNADFELDSDWTQEAATCVRSSAEARSGTYSWYCHANGSVAIAYQDMSSFIPGATYTVTAYYKRYEAAQGTGRVAIDDGISQTNGTASAENTFTQVTVEKTIAINADKLRLEIHGNAGASGGADRGGYFDDIEISISALSVGAPNHMANFNGELYAAYGTILCKLAAGRASWTVVADMGQTITALVPSVNSMLYIFFGDSSDNYWYMDADEAFTESDEYGYWASQFSNQLWWITTDGTVQYSATPNAAAVGESAGGTITDIASQIERFFVGRDSAGSTRLYCATNTILKICDEDTPEWLDTEVRIPLHPNGGKGACYYNGRIYISYGLGVKEYNPETGYIREIGLTERDGLPIEYNGEIVFLLGDSASKGMFAQVDASQTSGNSLSGLYKWHDGVWECWWIDTVNNQAMTEAIVSPAESGYAIYWGCGADVYYIDISRGIQNPDKISQNYATSGFLVTPWFDADSATASKLAKELLTLVASSSATEYVTLKYRINKATTAMASTWTTIDTYNSTAENTVNTYYFPNNTSKAGISFQTIQFRLDFTTAGSTDKPDIQDLTLWFRKNTGSQKQRQWVIPIAITEDQSHRSTDHVTAEQKFQNLEDARVSSTDVTFQYHPRSTDIYYVDLDFTGESETGDKYAGNYIVTLVES